MIIIIIITVVVERFLQPISSPESKMPLFSSKLQLNSTRKKGKLNIISYEAKGVISEKPSHNSHEFWGVLIFFSFFSFLFFFLLTGGGFLKFFFSCFIATTTVNTLLSHPDPHTSPAHPSLARGVPLLQVFTFCSV